MNPSEIDHLFRTEARKMIAVLTKIYGFHRIDLVEDIVQETFITAFETWRLKGYPEKPTSWLYAVARNKILNQLKRENRYDSLIAENQSILPLEYSLISNLETGQQQLSDSQIRMFFAVCHPKIPEDSQIALALRSLCAFGIGEIATAFLTTKETINKRLFRAKEKIKEHKIKLEFPVESQLSERLNGVLKCIYLLFNEGYYSSTHDSILRKELCLEAMRLCLTLLEFPETNTSEENALMALMCYHCSRFESRIAESGELLILDEQDKGLWERELIDRGHTYLSLSIKSQALGEYHLQAMIAYYHTTEDSEEKWQRLSELYEKYKEISSSPIVKMNYAYIISKIHGNAKAIAELEKIEGLEKNHLYLFLLAKLYKEVNQVRSTDYLKRSLEYCKSESEKKLILSKLN
jgi:RNA polymerase sigma factor (sigma-70 family)